MNTYPSTLLVDFKDKSDPKAMQEEIRKADLDLLDKINKISGTIPTNFSTTFKIGNDTFNFGQWYDYSTTVAFTGFGAPSAINMLWMREFLSANAKIWGVFTSGTPTATEAQMTLPLSIISFSTIATLQHCGTIATSATGAVQWLALIESSKSYITFGNQLAGVAGLVKRNGNNLNGIGLATVVSIQCEVPIEAWK